jgi:hypothetical protein
LKDIPIRVEKLLRDLDLSPDRDPNEIGNLTKKLEYLDETGRYSLLLKDFLRCNDLNNFKSIIVEAVFAYSFEVAESPLHYEISHSDDHDSSVDFLLQTQNGNKIFFELRVNQQQKQRQEEISTQLELMNMYSVSMNETDEQQEIIRLQSNILSKVQDKNGNPIKIFNDESGNYNIIAVEITDMILGTVDKSDCMLTLYGDPSVEGPFQRNIFGLFQKPEQHYPDHIRKISENFSHFRETVHGILFLARHPKSGPLDFDLRYHLSSVPTFS